MCDIFAGRGRTGTVAFSANREAAREGAILDAFALYTIGKAGTVVIIHDDQLDIWQGLRAPAFECSGGHLGPAARRHDGGDWDVGSGHVREWLPPRGTPFRARRG